VSDDAKSLISDYQALWQKQSNFRNLWNTAAQFVMPANDNFIGEFAEGVNRNTRIFDSTGVIANQRFAAAMTAMLTPSSQVWHKLKPDDEELEDDPTVQKYLDAVNKILFAARYHPEAGYAAQTDVCYLSLGAFGNNVLFIDDDLRKGNLRYRAWPLSELCWAVNHQGMVDTVYRKFRYTAKQAIQHWKGKANIPLGIQRTFESAPYTEAEYLHCIRPNYHQVAGGYGPKGMAFESWYVFLGDQSVIECGGYRTFPCAIGRYRVAPRESYGRGPATTCLPDIRTANEMVKTALRMGQKAVDPPILLAEDGVLTNFNQRPGANNYGMMTSDGKPLAMPFESKGNWQIEKDMLTDTRGAIKDTFLNTLFQILVDATRNGEPITATQALIHAQEKGELLAPEMGRQQTEFLGPQVHREIDLLSEARVLPPPPEALMRSKRGMRIEYTSPLARAQRAEEGTAIMNTVQDLGVMAQIDPSVKYIMDFHDAARAMSMIRGTPPKLLRTEEQIQALMEQAAKQQQETAALAAAPSVSTSALSLAKAAQIAGGQGTGPGAPTIPQGA